MPNYRDQIWDSLTAGDSGYAQRAGSKEAWMKDLYSSSSFTVNLYKWLKENNNDLVSDVSTPQDFYTKMTDGLGKGEPQKQISREQQEFNQFYSTYKPLLEGKKDEEIISAYKSGKIGNMKTGIFNLDSIDRSIKYSTQQMKNLITGDGNAYSGVLKPKNDFLSGVLKPKDDKIDDDIALKKPMYHNASLKFLPELSDEGGDVNDMLHSHFGKVPNSPWKVMTHDFALDMDKIGEVRTYLTMLKNAGASKETLDKVAYLNLKGNQQVYANKSKIDAVSPNNKGFESSVISTKDAQGESVGFGGFLTNYLNSNDGTPMSPEIVNTWWNEKTIEPIKQEDPKFFNGLQMFSDEETRDEYSELLGNYYEANSNWQKVQRGELTGMGIFNVTLNDQGRGQSLYNETLYDYANATNKLMTFWFNKSPEGAKLKNEITKASIIANKTQSEELIANNVDSDLNVVDASINLDGKTTDSSKANIKKKVQTIKTITDLDTYNSSANQISVLGRFTAQDADDIVTLNQESLVLRDQYQNAINIKAEEIYNGFSEEYKKEKGNEALMEATVKATEQLGKDPNFVKLMEMGDKYKSIIQRGFKDLKLGEIKMIIDPMTGETILNPKKEDLSDAGKKALTEYEEIFNSYNTGIFTNETVGNLLRNVQLALMTNIKDIRGVYDEAGYLRQTEGFSMGALTQEFSESFNVTTKLDSKTTADDFRYFDKAIANFDKTGLLNFEELTPLVGSSRHIAVQEYNSNLNKLRALSEVYLLNYDPLQTMKNENAKLKEDESYLIDGGSRLLRGMIDGGPEAIGLKSLSNVALTDEDIQQEFVYSMAEDFGIDENEKGEKLQDVLNKKIEDKSMFYKVGKVVPQFGVMLLETAAIEFATMGMGSEIALANIGYKATRMFRYLFRATKLASKAPRFSRRAATVMGGWTKAMVHEAMILEGSNQIGGALWGRERMPVGSFAFGAVGAKMGFKMLSRNYAGFKAAMLARQGMLGRGAIGKVWTETTEIMAKNPLLVGGISYMPKKMLQAGIGTATIKSGEMIGSIADLWKGEMSYQQFWDHALDEDSFIETFGAMMVMGARTSFKDGRLAFKHVSNNVTSMTGNAGTKKWNVMGKQMGLPKIKKWSRDSHGEGKTHWSEAQLAEAQTKKIQEINNNKNLNDAQKKAEIENTNKIFKFLSLKSALDGYRMEGEAAAKAHVFGEGTMNSNMDKIINRISRGENTNLRDQILLGQQLRYEAVDFQGKTDLYTQNRLIKELQGAGMSEKAAQNYVEGCKELASVQDGYQFKEGSNTQKNFFKAQKESMELNSKEKSLREAYKANNISKSTLDLELEMIKERQSELLEVERKLIKENAASNKADIETIKREFNKAEVKEYETTAELNEALKKFKDRGIEAGDINETNYGYNFNVGGKEFVFVDKSKANTARIEFEKEFERSKPMFGEAGSGNSFKIIDGAKKNTMFHEVIHPVIEGYIKGPKGEILVDQFVDVLKQTGEYELVLDQLKSHPDYKQGYRGSEWMTIYAEMVRDGRLDPYIKGAKKTRAFKNFKSKLNELISDSNKNFGEEFFADGVDARDFLLHYAKAEGKDFAKASKVANEAVQEFNNPSELFKSANKKVADVGPEINKLYLKYKDTWSEGGSRKALQEITKKGLLDKLIGAQLPVNRYEKGWTPELDKQFVQSVYGELTNHIKGFDKAKQTTSGSKGFFPWINSYIYQKGLNIKKAMGVFDTELSLDKLKEDGGFDPTDGSYKTFGEGPVKPAYKPLTSKQVLLKTKLKPESTTKLDKTFAELDFKKLIKAFNTPAGKNQTISPFIREFKKDFGAKGQKAVAETMGKKKADYLRYLDNAFEGIIETLPVGYLSRNFPYLVEKSAEASSTGRDNRFTSGPRAIKLKSNITELDKTQFIKDAAPSRWQAKRDGLAYQIADSYGSKRFLEIVDAKNEIENKLDLAEKDFETSQNELADGQISRKEFDVRRDNYMSDVKRLMAEGNAIEGFDQAFKEGDVKSFQEKVNQQIEISNFRKSAAVRKAINDHVKGRASSMLDIIADVNNKMMELAPKLGRTLDADKVREIYGELVGKEYAGGFEITKGVATAMAKEFVKTRSRVQEGFKATKLKIEAEGAKLKKIQSEIEKDVLEYETKEALDEMTAEKTEADKMAKQLLGEKAQYTLKENAYLRAEEGIVRTMDYFERKLDGLEGKELEAAVTNYLKNNAGHLVTAGGIEGHRGQFFKAMPDLLARMKPILEAKGVELEFKTNEKGRLTGGVKLNGEKLDLTKKSQKPESVRYLLDYVKEIAKDPNWAENNPEKFEKLVEEYETRLAESELSRDALVDEIVDDFVQFKKGKMDAEMLVLKLNSYNTNMRTHLREAAGLADVMVPLEGDILKDLTIEHKRAADPMLRRIVAEMQNKNNWKGLELKQSARENINKLFEQYETALVETSRTKGDKNSFDKMLEDSFKTETPRKSLIVKGGERYPRAYNKFTLGDRRARAMLDLKKYIETKDFEASKYGKEHEIAAKIERNEKVTDYDRKVVDNISYMSKSATKGKSKSELIEITDKADKALENGRKIDAPVKKARVFDFDDTVARTNSKVFATKGGEKKILTAEEFAKNGKDLVDAGWKMDFSDFNKVVDGKKGPLFDLMKKMKEAEGDRDMFILTARAAESAPAIHEFLKQMGIDIPLENIVGLGNSTGEAKAQWLVGKAGEGYNDFYFADDHMANVDAVKKALEPIDVKSQVQQARINKSSVDLDKRFNQIIEGKTGIGAEKEFSKAKAKVRGAEVSSYKLMGPSAQDFSGLMDYTLGKGKVGEAQREFYNETLYKPYSRAQRALSQDRVNLMSDFKALKAELEVPKDLRETTKSGFTKEQAVRVNLYTKAGYEVPGISKTDLAELNKIVENDPKLSTFANQILSITKGDGYAKPKQHWLSGTITTDFLDLLNTTKRGKYLQEWQANVDVMFSEKNMNKLEAAYGPKYREALENSLARMKAGKNRIQGGNRLSDRALDYINNAQGTIMFLNMRSALLQTISSANYTNLSFNNPLRMGQAFANQKQYWKDFMDIMNSDYLVDRRNGLKLNISESEIADAAATGGNKAKAAINYILEKGYAPTKFADSFAIASGGAMWYRNRIKDIIKKEGLSEVEAQKKAFEEFMEISEKSQQSSDPSKISQQQSTDMGRLLLQFVNTPMQYNRLQLADIKDLINRRGNPLQKISRIAYYGAVQNLWFNFMQQGLFALGFGDDDEFGDAEIEDKYLNTANSMFDSILRGTGLAGMTVSVIKNTVLDAYKRSGRTRPEYQDVIYKLLDFSPAIKNKFSKIKNAAYQFDSPMRRQQMIDKGFSLDNPAFTAFAKVVSAVTNVPLDRGLQKIENIQYAMSDDSETWQKVAALMGWPEWQLTGQDDKKENWEKEKEDFHYKQAIADPSKYSKEEQVDILKQHGYSEDDIKKMQNEGTRVATILKAQQDSGKIYKSKIPSIPKEKDKTTATPFVREEERTDISDADKKTNANVKKYYNMNKTRQVELLDSLGFSKKTIREKYNTEQKRVDKLLRLMENDSIPARLKKSSPIPASKRTKQQARLYKLNKQNQIDTLISLGLSDSIAKTLKYEADRVKKIEELYKNKNK